MSSNLRLLASWSGLIGLILALSTGLLVFSPLFAWERGLADMPALPLTGGLAAGGLLMAMAWPLIRTTLSRSPATQSRVLVLVLAGGAVMRLVMLASTPAFEDDWNRYLWDGAVTAGGLNPYAVAPGDVEADARLAALAETGRDVLERINHSSLKTIYPPVTQGAFALAYFLAPFSLTGWRLVCLAAELATLLLLLALLARSGRPPLWVALYWLNPLVAKELVNSAHMEAIVTPIVLAAFLLACTGRHVLAVVTIGLATGAKLWPILLAPLLLRPLIDSPRRLAGALVLLGGLVLLWAIPPWLGGLDESSGFVAYATHWRTSNALLPFLTSGAAWLLSPLSLPETTPGLVVRGGLGMMVLAAALWIAHRAVRGAEDLLKRAALTTLALLLASPAQFPWYLIWTLPFAVFHPLLGVMIAGVTLPFYYAGYHYMATDRYWIYLTFWVWMIWLPIWAALAIDAWQGRLGVHADHRGDKDA